MPYSEPHARRVLRKMRLVLRKYRGRNRIDSRYGRYTIINENNWIVAGSGDFDLELVDVTAFIDQQKAALTG